MDRKVYNIEEIEAYCQETMPLEERLLLEQQLQQDEVLQGQVKAFRKIFAGFVAMRDSRFSAIMKSWEEEGQETDDMELAEWYREGSLGERAQQAIKERQEKDAVFKNKVTEQKTLLDGFAAAQAEDFSEKMRQWETKEREPLTVKSRSPWIRRLSIAASFLVLIGVGLTWYVSNQYSNKALFATFYQSPNIGETMGQQMNDEFKTAFATAHRHLQARDFSAAISAFKQFDVQLETTTLDPLAQQYYTQNIAWSRLLSQLGLGQTDENFYAELDRIAADSTHEYQEQAKGLRSKLNSIFY